MTQTVRPRRSVLYMPGANERAMEKGKSLPADCLILDLEDSVAPEAKEEARAKVAAAVKAGGFGRREIIVRVNGLDTPWGHADIKAMAPIGADAILVPKVSDPGDVDAVAKRLNTFGAPDHTKIWAMMETPLAILNAAAIAARGQGVGGRLSCFVMGTNDLSKMTRALQTADRIAMLSWLQTALAAARAYGLDIVDGVYTDLKNEAGLRAECEQGRTLGMDGKTLIHPNQIATANDVFAPSAEEDAWSRRILAAFALPENKGKGVIALEGRMVERLHAEIAARTVALTDAIREMQAAAS